MTELAPTRMSPAAADAAVGAALWAALRTFGRIPGARVVNESDVTLVLTGTPHASFNNIVASAIADDDAGWRIPAVLREIPTASLPATWWVGPTTQPTDLAARLARLGLVRQAPEFAMVLDVAAGWADAPLADGATLEPVDLPNQLDHWLGVMNASYGWPDAAKTAIVRSMYLADLSVPAAERDIHHFLLRLGGQAAACSSLFVGSGEAFVTNIGTTPGARGRGLGSAVTAATLDLARQLGRTCATLTASVDGRGVYRRLGFVEAGVLERFVATPAVVAGLAAHVGQPGGVAP